MNDYYVYVYIDPRNFEEFYFGKGKGSRKEAHLFDKSGTEKAKRIATIKKEGLEPIVRVIARNLSEHDALLVEKTLLWKLGKNLTNISSGHYAENFRPHETLHKQISGFDFKNGFYYYNVGEGPNRNWDDYTQYGFISAGGGPQWRDPMLSFRVGDLIAAYLKGRGYVGIGQIIKNTQPIRNVEVNGKPLLSLPLIAEHMDRQVESDEFCEYVALVDWKRSTLRNQAKKKSKIFTTTHIRASLDNQQDTVAFLESEFGFKLEEFLI